MLREVQSFDIPRFGAAVAAVRQGSSERALLVENRRAVADESAYGDAGTCRQFRAQRQVSRRPREIQKKIAAVGFEIEQPKIEPRILIARGLHLYRLAPKQFSAHARRRRIQLGFNLVAIAAGGNDDRIVTGLRIGGVVDQETEKF